MIGGRSDQQTIDFDNFGEGKFAYLTEVGWTPNFDGKHAGNYKVTVGYVDETAIDSDVSNQSGWWWVLSAQQDIRVEYGVFGIVRRSHDRIINNTETAAGAGFTLKKPLGRTDDMLGFGAFYAKPFDSANDKFQDEYGIEAFWNLQLTPRLKFAPDIQLYLQPGFVEQDDKVFVAGFRLQYVL